MNEKKNEVNCWLHNFSLVATSKQTFRFQLTNKINVQPELINLSAIRFLSSTFAWFIYCIVGLVAVIVLELGQLLNSADIDLPNLIEVCRVFVMPIFCDITRMESVVKRFLLGLVY